MDKLTKNAFRMIGLTAVLFLWCGHGALAEAQSNPFPATGNVGIGTTSPSKLLHLFSTEPRIYLTDSDVSGMPYSYVQATGGHLALGADGGNVTASSHLRLEVDGTEHLRIDSSGNVGIGTTNPQSKLAVNGTITAKELVVTIDPNKWADFVFEEGYDLMPLDQLEEHIKTNKHLPEIPSAQEVAKNGVKVGDIQTRLLQKVEELTLYVIDIKKENINMQKENEALKKRVGELETGL